MKNSTFGTMYLFLAVVYMLLSFPALYFGMEIAAEYGNMLLFPVLFVPCILAAMYLAHLAEMPENN